MVDDMKQQPLNLQQLAKNIDLVRKSADNKALDTNYADMDDVLLTSRYKRVREVQTHREKVDESASLLVRRDSLGKAEEKLASLDLISSKSDMKNMHDKRPKYEAESAKLKQNLE